MMKMKLIVFTLFLLLLDNEEFKGVIFLPW